MKYKYLLFDADNTLFDFDKAEHKAFLALSKIDGNVFVEENYHKYHKINDDCWKRLERKEITKAELKSARFAELYVALGLPFDNDLINTITEQYPRNLALGCDLIDGAIDIVKHLSGKYKIYIVTNGLYDVQTKRLSSSEIHEYVEKAFISEQIGYDKPDKRYFDQVINDIGDSSRESYLVIGDSLTSDIDGAIASGIDSVFYDPRGKGVNGRNVNYVIRDLEQLKNIL